MFGRQVLAFGSQNFRKYLTFKSVKINRKYHEQLFHRAAAQLFLPPAHIREARN